MHEFLATVPFDLYELHLVHLVAEHRSFTAAARLAGLTQSAITRQVQGVEFRLGTPLFERTTRSVRITPAGEFLLREGSRVLGDLDAILKRFREQHTSAPKEVKVGVSTSISMAYLPGFFAAQQRRRPEVRLRIVHLASQDLIERVETNSLDVAILCPPKRPSKTLRISHRFADAFDLILPARWEIPAPALTRNAKRWTQWLNTQPWLLLREQSNTGARLRAWLRRRGWPVEAAMELDSFDLIINLVALGQGISMVPKRALAIYNRQRRVRRVPVPDRFTRELVVVTRRHPEPPPHIQDFTANILF